MMMKIGKMRDDKKYIGRGIVNILVGIVVSFLLSAVSLYFATDKYGIEMFQSYFENGYIVFLNTLPVFFSIMFVFLICNQLWIGISITSILVIVLSLINYFKLLFRDDPLLVEDLNLFSEMKNMTGRYKIHINRDMILWILGMTVVILIEFDSENDPYAAFNRIKDITYHGNLLTDIFAAGTVRTERRFITGADAYPSLRKNTYSYARYFTDQGYCVEGSHPCYSWFYNRINVNDHLGFSKYDFYESRYSELTNGEIAGDNVLFPELYKDLKNSIDDGIPYFNLSVTYQNHGPYSTEQLYDTSYVIKQEDYTDDEYNILNNYLSGIKNTGEELEKLIEEIESLDEPCVLVAFGDHKPWLGEGNSVYEMLGIDLDVSTLEGFYNYYATPYIMYANHAAKQITGNQFVGEGTDIAPNYLMNELFEKLGYDGPAFMKITNSVRETITAHSGEIFVENGEVVDELSDKDQQIWNQYKKYEYYFMNQKMK